MNPISISIVEDDDYFIEIIKETIEKENQFKLNFIYKNYQSAVKGFSSHPTDVLLIDIQLPDDTGIHLLSKLKPLYPTSHFIICTSFENSEQIFNALKAGADGYILKVEPYEKINEAIHEVLRGGAPMSSIIAKKVVAYFYKEPTQGLQQLTSKENELLRLLADGKLYKEIAVDLNISMDTVKKHSSNIYKKLHVSNRTEATNLFRAN